MYGGNAQAPTHDGVILMNCADGGNYSRFGEKLYDANTGSDATIGIIAHELGHAVFSLPDLYDTDGSSEGIGKFGLMGGGSWTYKSGDTLSGMTPVHMTAWSKIKSGFITAKTIIQTQNNINIYATNSSSYIPYKIETGTPGEYFLIENRDNSGYDRGLYSLSPIGSFTGGLLILHIDDNQNNNQDETHKWVDIEEANNPVLDTKINRGENVNLFYLGNQMDFSQITTPNSNKYDGNSSGLDINNISAEGAIMHLDITIQ
jgi:hypothetical protein